MQDFLILYLNAAKPSWVVVDANLAIKTSQCQGDPQLLAELAVDKHVTVLVPAEDVLLTQAKLPVMRKQRLLQALPFALEEQLVDEVEALHFALGPYQEQAYYPVAVVAQEKMQQWLALLASWQVQADVLQPMTLALPLVHDTYVARVEKRTHEQTESSITTIRTSLYDGYACDTANLATFLNLSLSHAKQIPERLALHNHTPEALPGDLQLPIKLTEIHYTQDQWFAELISTVTISPGMNLLQGVYQVKKSRMPQVTKIWRLTTYAAIAWVALLFIYPLVSYFILRHQVNQIDESIAAIYYRQFPQASSVIAPKLRVEEKLRQLTGRGSENRLLILLAFVGQAIAANQSVNLQRLDYQHNQLILALSATSADAFSSFADYLTQHGLSVKQQNANVEGEHVTVTLLVE